MDEEEYERAAMLAEKYLDFQVLVDICQKTNNREKLNSYIEKFSDQGFSKFLFTWYIREHKQASLVQHCNERGGEQLVPLLSEQPSLSWLHDLALRQYRQAADTLTGLAQQETQLLQRKKSQLSLAKLALLASPDPCPGLEELNSALTLIAYQEQLPSTLLTSYGYDSDNMRLFSPSELIKLYISDENPASDDCITFTTALDVLSYVEHEQDRDELNSEIWTKAVLKDSWIDMDPNSPQSVVQQMFIFRLIDLCILRRCEDMVPSIEDLLACEELATLKENSTFLYLLQVGYEHFTKHTVMAM
uniref:Nucleoporin Nup133/Nup155-like C-terminal domain-containing protein n=1 Tax=Homalodisca liturata TaxID=320908 RepID=A0A1B6K7B6_9HEMI